MIPKMFLKVFCKICFYHQFSTTTTNNFTNLLEIRTLGCLWFSVDWSLIENNLFDNTTPQVRVCYYYLFCFFLGKSIRGGGGETKKKKKKKKKKEQLVKVRFFLFSFLFFSPSLFILGVYESLLIISVRWYFN